MKQLLHLVPALVILQLAFLLVACAASRIRGRRQPRALAFFTLNGIVIHENLTLSGPTRGGGTTETPLGPIRLQGDHGPVAYRGIEVRRISSPQ